MTHAAQPLLSGERIVAVASFSPQEFRGIVRPPRDLRLFQAGFFGAAAAGSRSEGGSTCCEGDDGDDDGDADGDGGGVLVGSSGASGGDWAKGLKSGQPNDFRPTLRPPASSHPAVECSLEEMCEALMGPAHSTTPPIQGSAGGAERAGADGALIRLPDVSAQGASAVICALKDVGLPDAAQRSGGHTFSECSQEHDGSSQSLGSQCALKSSTVHRTFIILSALCTCIYISIVHMQETFVSSTCVTSEACAAVHSRLSVTIGYRHRHGHRYSVRRIYSPQLVLCPGKDYQSRVL